MSAAASWLLLLALALPPLLFYGVTTVVVAYSAHLGRQLRSASSDKRAQILQSKNIEHVQAPQSRSRRSSQDWEKVEAEEKQAKTQVDPSEESKPPSWRGIVGFFHPYCNAGGGGERVLWAALRATQERWPKAHCIVYTGDHELDKAAMLSRIRERFDIDLEPSTLTFLYLTTRHWVHASTWPRFTLLGQSLGSLILAWDAFSLLVPDIFVDTMGYAFVLGLSKLLFPDVPTGAYVHYPTISTDMLDSLGESASAKGMGVNAGKGKGAQGWAKRFYWRLFAALYSWMGSSIDIVMTNSSWTLNHITNLWEPRRRRKGRRAAGTVFPPVAVEAIEDEIDVSLESEKSRRPEIVYIAQFRPEKNHKLIIEAFADFAQSDSSATHDARLILMGSVRDDADAKRVYELRLLCNELRIRDRVDFRLDVPWPQVLACLRHASIGVNGMWNEHFGIGVVEYQAAGLMAVVHDSGGPKQDIVVDVDGQPTGAHATTAHDFAKAFDAMLSLSAEEKLGMRQRARRSAMRFTEARFRERWTAEMGKLIELRENKAG